MVGSVSAKDAAFLKRFNDCELPECEWTHTAHIRVAWICLSTLPQGRVQQEIRNGILRYNTEVLSRRHKYHETVTVAFTRLVAARMIAGESWDQFAQRIAELLDSDNPVLLRYYSSGLLFSDAARESFVNPDLKELPSVAGG